MASHFVFLNYIKKVYSDDDDDDDAEAKAHDHEKSPGLWCYAHGEDEYEGGEITTDECAPFQGDGDHCGQNAGWFEDWCDPIQDPDICAPYIGEEDECYVEGDDQCKVYEGGEDSCQEPLTYDKDECSLDKVKDGDKDYCDPPDEEDLCQPPEEEHVSCQKENLAPGYTYSDTLEPHPDPRKEWILP